MKRSRRNPPGLAALRGLRLMAHFFRHDMSALTEKEASEVRQAIDWVDGAGGAPP